LVSGAVGVGRSRATGDEHIYPRLSKDYPSLSKETANISKEIPNLFFGRFQRKQRGGGNGGRFALSCAGSLRIPRTRTAQTPRARLFSLSRVLFFRNKMTRRILPGSTFRRPRRGGPRQVRQGASSTSWRRLFSAAEGLSRGEARLRRRAERRALDSPSASEVLASMRSTARWVGGRVRRALGGACWSAKAFAHGERTFEPKLAPRRWRPVQAEARRDEAVFGMTARDKRTMAHDSVSQEISQWVSCPRNSSAPREGGPTHLKR
jgi:hypothetical protein